MPARLALILVTALWGSTFLVIHAGLDRISPLLLLGTRCLVGAAALALVVRPSRGVWRRLWPILPLSTLLFLGMALQTQGLTRIAPSRSAFLTALSVVIVPVLDRSVRRTVAPRTGWLPAVLAVLGVYLLCAPIAVEWNLGDSLTLVGAVAFAAYVVELGRIGSHHPVRELVFAQTLTVGLLAMVAAGLVGQLNLEASLPVLWNILYLGIPCTALTFWLMTWGQAQLGPLDAAIIYTFEPVMTALFAVGLGREPLRWPLIQGGGFILAAMLLSAWPGAARLQSSR